MADAELPENFSFKPSEDRPELDNSWGLTDHGTASYTNGDKYLGYFADGKKHGKGVYTFLNGDEYEGPYVENQRHGVGILRYADGQKYHGNFSNGKKNGEGTYFYTNGDIYCGNWKESRKHGYGVYVFHDAAQACLCSYEGTWDEGQFVSGKYKLGEKVFEGTFLQQKPIGEGVWTLKGGKVEGAHTHQVLPVDSAPDDFTTVPSQEVRVAWDTRSLVA